MAAAEGESDAKDFTNEFVVEDAAPAHGNQEAQRETDPHRLAQRQKQLAMGKNTLGYQRYREAVPKDQRTRKHPSTPDVHQVTSKRAFEGQVKKWRRMLHEWDPSEEGATAASNPAAPEGASLEAQESYELVNHADAAEAELPWEQREDAAAERSGADPVLRSKNGWAMRQVTSSLPLKVPGMVGGSKRSLEQAEQGSAIAWDHQRNGSCKQAAGQEGRRAVTVAAAPLASGPDMTCTGLPELDWGEDSNDGWEVVKGGPELPGQYISIYNNWGGDAGEDDVNVVI